MLVAFSVAPSGTPDGTVEGQGGAPAGAAPADGSVTAAVADAVRVVRESGLPHRTDAMVTTVECERHESMDVVRRAGEAAGRHGSRGSLVLKADIRPGRTVEMQGKLDRLEAALDGTA